ncbi:hypothetical protein [Bdellovibrio sp.]|uniref:hypothetical protein n=1 Tax=Bdellovibrio sp. TaxID=28201 RepID=UPI0039E588E0
MLLKIVTYIILSSLTAHAFDAQDILLYSLCKKDRKTCSSNEFKLVEKFELQCRVEQEGHRCQELSAKNPEWAPLMRKCDFESLCKEFKEYQSQSGIACLRGYKNAMVDLGISIKDMAFSLGGFIEDSWEKFKKSNRDREAFLKQCNQSLLCKRDLVKDDHRYNNLPDEKLDKFTATFLYVQAQDMKNFKASAERVRPKPYVPISERTRDDTDLTEEQKFKMSGLLDAAEAKIKEQYDRYLCYNRTAREELKCYAVGNVIDPTLFAGYFIKGARVVAAAGRLSKVEKAGVEVEKSVATMTARSTFRTRGELIDKYLHYSPATTAQNEKWIAQAEKGTRAKMTFFDVENSQMKVLNDTLKDKNLVTSLTNYHKDILFSKMEALQKEFPNLIIDKYSDFKSSRFAFSGSVPKDIEKRLDKIFRETNEEFSTYLKENKILRTEDSAETWFRGGVGRSADQANLAARYSRGQNNNVVQNYAQESMQQSMSRQLSSLDRQRKGIRDEVGRTGMVEGQTLHQDVFDIVRKNQGEPDKISQALTKRFALSELPRSTVMKIQDYVKATDSFSPGIHIASREVAHLNDAAQGGLSADIIGLGAANLKGTAEALASAKNVDQALELTRTAEKAVTQSFKDQKKYFEEVIRRSVSQGKLKTLCSGDDCVSVAVSPLNEAEKTKILAGLADSKYSGGYRLAFIPEGVAAAETRNALATHGESMEKILRKTLGASMEPRKLQGLTFGVDMKTQKLNQGSVKLLIGEAPGVRLTEKDRVLIERTFRQAVEELNQEVSKEGVQAMYRATH